MKRKPKNLHDWDSKAPIDSTSSAISFSMNERPNEIDEKITDWDAEVDRWDL